MKLTKIVGFTTVLFAVVGCNDNDVIIEDIPVVPTELSDEWYAGGKLGTAFNTTSFAYEQPSPAVEENSTMMCAFKFGEYLFEKDFNENTEGAFCGLGPLMVRR